MAEKSPVVAAVKGQELARLKRLLAAPKQTIPAAAVVEAGRLGWQAGLALLSRHGADLDASYRNYRALHSLIQEEPHAGGSSTPRRVACLEWLLAHGADPEQLGAWPAARALVIAAFVGEAPYVEALKRGGAKVDLFTAAALGDAKRVTRFLERDAGGARARDGGLLTALHCCAGSRMGKTGAKTAAGLLEVARRLIEAGADVNAEVKSWGNEVNVSYFAIGAGQIDLLELLLAHGLDATAAVATAAWKGRGDLVDLLVAHGARIDAALEKAKPVLNELVRWGQLAPARMMLGKGASPNIPDERGWTAVHRAVSRGNAGMLRNVMAAGGDAARRDGDGQTPRDLARAKRRKDLLAILG